MANGRRARFQRLLEAPELCAGGSAASGRVPAPAQPQCVCTRVHACARKGERAGGGALRVPHEGLREGAWPAQGAEQPPPFGRKREQRRRRLERVGAGDRRGSRKGRVGPGPQPSPAGAPSPHPAGAAARGRRSPPFFQPLLGHCSGSAVHPRADVEGHGPAVPRLSHVRQPPACGQPAALGRWLPGCALPSVPPGPPLRGLPPFAAILTLLLWCPF